MKEIKLFDGAECRRRDGNMLTVKRRDEFDDYDNSIRDYPFICTRGWYTYADNGSFIFGRFVERQEDIVEILNAPHQAPDTNVNNPSHYGGRDNPYEAIKVIENWKLNFNLGNAAKYISRAGKKGDKVEDLNKAIWYLKREVELITK